MSENEKTQEQDTLGDTFSLFFGPSEETHGTGTVTRVIKGELTEVVVDEAEHEAFQAQAQKERAEIAAEEAAIRDMMGSYYDE